MRGRLPVPERHEAVHGRVLHAELPRRRKPRGSGGRMRRHLRLPARLTRRRRQVLQAGVSRRPHLRGDRRVRRHLRLHRRRRVRRRRLLGEALLARLRLRTELRQWQVHRRGVRRRRHPVRLRVLLGRSELPGGDVRCRGARAVTTRFERWALGAVGCARVNGAGGAAGKGGGPAAGGGIGAPSGSAGAAAVTGPPATVTVAGDVIAATFAPDEKPALDAAAPPNAAGTIAYPTDGALFPSNWGAITIQVKKTDPAQDSGRVAISGKGIDIKYYAACETWPNSSVGCSITVPSSLTGAFAAASEAGDLTLTARLAG